MDASAIYIDRTHIKTSANRKRKEQIENEISAREYQAELNREIEQDRLVHRKKPLKHKDDDEDIPPETM